VGLWEGITFRIDEDIEDVLRRKDFRRQASYWNMKRTKIESWVLAKFAFGHTQTSCISFSGHGVLKQRDDIDGLSPGCSGRSGLHVEGSRKTSEGLGLGTTNSLTAWGVDQGQRKAEAGKSEDCTKGVEEDERSNKV